MGRSKSTLEESEVADLLAMKGEFMQHREETADLRGEVDDLRKDVHNINLKQDTMVSILDGVQKAVPTLSSQLSTMAEVLKSLRSTEASSSAQQGKSSPDLPQKETATVERAMSEEIRRRLVMEQEKSRLAAAHIPIHLPPIQFSKMSKYDMTGIGLNIREIPDDNGSLRLVVLGLILDGPANSAGVRQGDELLSVNGSDVRGKSAFDVSSMLQGPKETFVTIKVKHGNCGPVESMKVQRQMAARTPIFYRLEKRDNENSSVGYIHIKEFNAVAKKDLVSALKRLQNSGASYFVLDLRDNLGGLVQAGIEIAKLFLNKGDTVIYTTGRDRQVQNTIVADSGPLVTTPVMVLVNNRTASASEIVASALHDNCKAVLVGERTFGKGLIQSVFELHDGSGIVVTVGKSQ
ncbi:D1 protease-like protein precursor [Hordeum vulgare]|nr:D1 protease-like protein precursor [Hordeum vulgare]